MDENEPKLIEKLGWFCLLYLAGLVTILAVAYGLRALIL